MEMDALMACTANCDEIFFHVASLLAPRLNVMNLEIFGTTASLASPAITLENSLPKPPIGMSIQAKSGLFRDG